MLPRAGVGASHRRPSRRRTCRHLKNVVLLTPGFRLRSATRTALGVLEHLDDLVSLNFDFLLTAPVPEQSIFDCQSIGEAYDRKGRYHLARESIMNRLKVQEERHGRQASLRIRGTVATSVEREGNR